MPTPDASVGEEHNKLSNTLHTRLLNLGEEGGMESAIALKQSR